MTPNVTYSIMIIDKVICSITVPTEFKNQFSRELKAAISSDDAFEILRKLRDDFNF